MISLPRYVYKQADEQNGRLSSLLQLAGLGGLGLGTALWAPARADQAIGQYLHGQRIANWARWLDRFQELPSKFETTSLLPGEQTTWDIIKRLRHPPEMLTGRQSISLDSLYERLTSPKNTRHEQALDKAIRLYYTYNIPKNIRRHLLGAGGSLALASLPVLSGAAAVAPREALPGPWQTVEDVGRYGLTAALSVPALSHFANYVSGDALSRMLSRRPRLGAVGDLALSSLPILAGLGFVPRLLHRRTLTKDSSAVKTADDQTDALASALPYAGLGALGSGLTLRGLAGLYDHMNMRALMNKATVVDRLFDRWRKRHVLTAPLLRKHVGNLGSALAFTAPALLAASSVLAPRPALEGPWQTVEDVGRIGLTGSLTSMALPRWASVPPFRGFDKAMASMEKPLSWLFLNRKLPIGPLALAAFAGMGFLPRWLQKRTSKE